MSDLAGIIIAGGFGTRLRPLTYSRPKHLLPVANRPFLEYQVALLREAGVREIVFATNYFAEQIEAHFGDGTRFGVAMRYAVENEPLGTAGAIRNAAEVIGACTGRGRTLIALNGDVMTDFDLAAIAAFHGARSAVATIALRPVPRPHAFGALAVEQDGRVTSWHEPTDEEKRRVLAEPGPPTAVCDFINAGVYILAPSVVADIPAGRPVSIERETYPRIIESGAAVYGYAPEGYWTDIGNPEQYLAANRAVLTGEVRTTVPWQQIGERCDVSRDAELDATSVLGAGVTVGAGSRVLGSILMDGVQIGANVRLSGVVAEPGVLIEDDAVLASGATATVLAAGTVIARGSRL